MERVSLTRALDFVAGTLVQRRSGLALTGAGISVPSGIADFRSPGGLWDTFDPKEHATIGAFRADPERSWKMLSAQEATIRRARPNPAHLALARLERLGVLYGVITQNVDSLHQEAGSACVVELHGSFRRLVCPSTRCDQVLDASQRQDLGLPICSCGQVLKPDVILFGEQLDDNTLTAARQLTQTCGVMLVIGTSAAVPPAAAFPQLASAGGALVVELNIEPTAITEWCEVTILGDAAETLPKLTDRVAELMGETPVASS